MNILVVGGNRGVGLEISNNCIAKGWKVAIIAKEQNTSFKTCENVLYKSIDLCDLTNIQLFIQEIISLWGKIDGVVFYAGITPIASLIDCTEELYDRIFEINLKSTFFITKSILKNMLENGGGSLVFFGTSHMESGEIDRAVYAISKGGLKILSEHLARRYAKYQIRSNIVVMGWTPTEGELDLRASQGITKEELLAQASEHIPMGRMLTVNDPVPAVMYFLSDEAAMVTGSTIRCNGGEYI
jgi:NAD(P)-dependent dehydrogenase (short-subunit alcohol dehydrogenase family)